MLQYLFINLICNHWQSYRAWTAEGVLGWGSKVIFNSFLSMQHHRTIVEFHQNWGGQTAPADPRFCRQCYRERFSQVRFGQGWSFLACAIFNSFQLKMTTLVLFFTTITALASSYQNVQNSSELRNF